jgi:C1A family cysteine protease
MPNTYSVKGRGLVPDDDDKNDKYIEADKLHHDVDMNKLTSMDIFRDKFKFADGQLGSYETFGVYNQGNISSCTSNAVSAAYRYMLQRHRLPKFEPSRLFLYYLARTPLPTIIKSGFRFDQKGSYYESLQAKPPSEFMIYDEGTMIRENVRILARLGVPPEHDWPYNINIESNDGVFPKESNVAKPPPAALFKNIQQQIVFHYVRPHIGDLKCWKQCIANGYPIICGIDEYARFEESITTGDFCAVTPAQGDAYETAHTILLVGWDDNKVDSHGNKGFFKVQNSEGTTEKWDGFFWMSYSWVTTDSSRLYPDDEGNLVSYKLAYSPWVLVDRTDLVSTV